MFLKRITILNYKNLEQVDLHFSKKLNCIIGKNGMGKTNLMDAVYYLSFCKSATNPIDSQNILHEREFFVIQGFYETDTGDAEEIYCGLKRKSRKQFKRNKKEYQRLADHIGLIPLLMVSPSDSSLISGGSEERRRFMDIVISQYDRNYLDSLIRYNKALSQRNAMLKAESEPDPEVLKIWEDMMDQTGQEVYEKRKTFIDELVPVFQSYYSRISKGVETVSLSYQSDLERGRLGQTLQSCRQRDRLIGFTTCGVHKDDLTMQLGDYAIRREGSQGQNKTYLIALKLAQFDFLKRTGSRTTPIVLLDDIFDKLDADRVEQIVKIVAGDDFGQIFITDTNRDNLDKILQKTGGDCRLFTVTNGQVEA